MNVLLADFLVSPLRISAAKDILRLSGDGHYFEAGYLGLCPIPYGVYKVNTSQAITDGMNYAVGGSGEFDNLGFTKTSDQISEFRQLITAGVYNISDIVDKSLILLSISGNDYASVVRKSGITVTFTDQDLKNLQCSFPMV